MSCPPAAFRVAPNAAALALVRARCGACDAVQHGVGADLGEATCAWFDRDRVSLAAGDNRGRVAIYDFDNVHAVDSRGRNGAGPSPAGNARGDAAVCASPLPRKERHLRGRGI